MQSDLRYIWNQFSAHFVQHAKQICSPKLQIALVSDWNRHWCFTREHTYRIFNSFLHARYKLKCTQSSESVFQHFHFIWTPSQLCVYIKIVFCLSTSIQRIPRDKRNTSCGELTKNTTPIIVNHYRTIEIAFVIHFPLVTDWYKNSYNWFCGRR